MNYIVNNIFSVNDHNFTEYAINVFRYQYTNNAVYKRWVNYFGTDVNSIKNIKQIPFLPISFFKSDTIVSGSFQPEAVFESSGTTGTVNSKHFVKDVGLYINNTVNGFQMFYGEIKDWCIIGLLPSYLQRKGSSLVVMVNEFIRMSAHPKSGFYLYEYEKLAQTLSELEAAGQKTLLIGVTYAMLDFAEKYPMKLKHTILMETGGMKGRRKELVQQQVHEILRQHLGVEHIHAEYGMTEMLSQAYSTGSGLFRPVPWMKVLIRDEMDPLRVCSAGKGIINIIDLANVHSCSFFATNDAGMLHSDGSFEVLGRIDNSDIRGCSLLLS